MFVPKTTTDIGRRRAGGGGPRKFGGFNVNIHYF